MAKRGHPPSFSSKEDFENSVSGYMEECINKHQMPNIAGLCVFLDISRDTFYEYAKKAEYSDTIKRVRAHIENAWVQRLSEMGATGAIFYLKNAFREDYKDRHETDVTSGGKPLPLFDYVSNRKNNGNRENTETKEED